MSDQTPAESPAQGWYTDPQEPARLRWWDGAQWTEHVHPPAGQAPETQAAPATGAATAAPTAAAGTPAATTTAAGSIVTSTAPAGTGAGAERGAIGRWLSVRSNVALLVILVIAIIIFVLVMTGALT